VTDIPAHTYQLTFEPNHEWPQFYAKSTDIYKYWKKVAEKYNCMKYIKLEHQVVEARWSAEESKWHLKVRIQIIGVESNPWKTVLKQWQQIRNLASGTIFADSCDVFISASGVLNDWKWPSIPGLHNFKGKLLHSAKWDQDFDYSARLTPPKINALRQFL
jgi:cation diffusion facilitator CzcD-associated flavoprotein CzcO